MADHRAELRLLYPVVLWADVNPMIGMLMIPKTCAYVWTVLIGYNAMKLRPASRANLFPRCLTESPPTDSDALLCRRAFLYSISKTIGNALRIALGIFSGKNILNFGVSKHLRVF